MSLKELPSEGFFQGLCKTCQLLPAGQECTSCHERRWYLVKKHGIDEQLFSVLLKKLRERKGLSLSLRRLLD